MTVIMKLITGFVRTRVCYANATIDYSIAITILFLNFMICIKNQFAFVSCLYEIPKFLNSAEHKY